MERQRVLIAGAGAAGIGIARILRAELGGLGVQGEELTRAIAVLDSRGLLVEDRDFSSDYKREFAWPRALVQSVGLSPGGGDDLLECVEALEPTVLIGTSGQAGTFTEAVVRAMAQEVDRPVIFPFSNPNSKAEAHPKDIVEWSDGRALVATGSPFDPVAHGDRLISVAQGNNVYVFPGVGLGTLASGATEVVDSMFTAAAHAIAAMVDEQAIARGELYPPLPRLRAISREVAFAVGKDAMKAGVAPEASDEELRQRIDELVWEPRYPQLRL